jgi:hypothetical protein
VKMESWRTNRPISSLSHLACHKKIKVVWRIVSYYVLFYLCLANYDTNEAVNLCSRYVEKSAKYSEQKCASYFRE